MSKKTKVVKTEKYTLGYFLRKFRSIPAWKWTEGQLTSVRTWGKHERTLHCALGFCKPGKEASSLHNIFYNNLNIRVVDVNDYRAPGSHLRFRHADKPKDRIVGALKAIRSKQRKAKKVA